MSTSLNQAAANPTKYIPALDGLRAIAVSAVLIYHAGFGLLPGGFLGVDLFFVISGYVITRLLLNTLAHSGGLDLKAFYRSRIRRLYPGLLLTVFGTLILISFQARDSASRFFHDLPFALSGTINWKLIVDHQDYFATTGRPPLLQHLWSLAVEAQFYLFWPVVLLLALRYLGKRHLPKIALLVALGSSVALFATSWRLNQSNSIYLASRASHIYFGTDTHSLGLFLGSALAVSWAPINLTSKVSKRAQDFIDLIGSFGFLGALSCFLFLNEANQTLYRWAFPAIAFAGLAIITSIVHPASRFAPLISHHTLIWIGQRSYAIYLWHWPIFQLTRPGIDLIGNHWALQIARFLLVFAVADLSYRFIELPIRRNAISLFLAGRKYRTEKNRNRQDRIVIAGGLTVVVLISVASYFSLHNKTDQQNTSANQTGSKIYLIGSSNIPSMAPLNPHGIWLTGDSVILGIRAALAVNHPLALVNARVGRQIGELIAAVKHDQPSVAHQPIVLDLGNNNLLQEGDVKTLFDLLAKQPKVIVVDAAVPRPWQDENNSLIKKMATPHPNFVVIDWAAISTGHPEYFASDGVHLNEKGGQIYVAAISEHL